jgi:hypothetical protein
MCLHKNESDTWKCGEKAYEFLRSTVQTCFDRRLLRGDNVELIAFSMWSAVHGMVSLKLRNRLNIYDKITMPEGFNKDMMIQASVEMMFKLFIS